MISPLSFEIGWQCNSLKLLLKKVTDNNRKNVGYKWHRNQIKGQSISAFKMLKRLNDTRISEQVIWKLLMNFIKDILFLNNGAIEDLIKRHKYYIIKYRVITSLKSSKLKFISIVFALNATYY